MSLALQENVRLADHTTLEVGGPARFWLTASNVASVAAALTWARERQLAVHLLGGGSNVVIADRGLDGLVLHVGIDELTVKQESDSIHVHAGAGVRWDELVRRAVAAGAGGVECLSGIPGDVGAVPIQNVGAYGQEVADCVEAVHVVARDTGRAATLSRDACRFSYRHSAFKAEAQDRYVITAVDLRLRTDVLPTVEYPELAGAVEQNGGMPTLAAVRNAVLRLRRAKSMLAEPDDPNRRSVGSFFLNPTLSAGAFTALERRAAATLGTAESLPHHPLPDGQVKVPAAWLIEHAGMPKGTIRGRVGISTRHSLALINRGGATAAELVAFAAEVRQRVRDTFAITLAPEPRLLGFERDELAALVD